MPLCPPSSLACLLLATTQVGGKLSEALEPRCMSPVFIDRSVNPVADFYRFCNGRWLDQVQIPASETQISATALARMRTAFVVNRMIASLDTAAAPGSPEQLVGDFYRVGANANLAESAGIRPLESELKRIDEVESTRGVMAELGRLHRWDLFGGFSVHTQIDLRDSRKRILSLQQSSLSLLSPEPYLHRGSRSIELLARLKTTIGEILGSIGEPDGAIESDSADILKIEEGLAEAGHHSDQTINPALQSRTIVLAELGNDVPKTDWWAYFDRLGDPLPKRIAVDDIDYLKRFGELLNQVPVASWRAYLKWVLVYGCSPYLSERYASKSNALIQAVRGQQQAGSREEGVLAQTDICLGSEVGYLLARTGYADGAKEKILPLVNAVKRALKETIGMSAWLSPGAKAKALDKLERLQVSVGFPEHWRNSSSLVIKQDSYVQNVLRAHEFSFQRRLDELDRPVDRSSWFISPYRVDAYYSKSLNMIVLPAGILQPPFFDPDGDPAANFGAIGSVIGHEFTHAFDDEGRRFDADGNLNDWWSRTDEVRFKRYEDGIVSQFEAYNPLENTKVDGRLTLAENIADLGGVKVAFKAYQAYEAANGSHKQDGFTGNQRFFISFGQLLRSKIRPETMRFGLENDSHAPPRFRVNGVVQNIPEFWKAFNVDPPGPVLTIW
ncbi:MAG: M13 family metallopeptidase [Fimbriimonas sp.]|nr:M13 family metallopeptidase [Fimbriimonas sp.]